MVLSAGHVMSQCSPSSAGLVADATQLCKTGSKVMRDQVSVLLWHWLTLLYVQLCLVLAFRILAILFTEWRTSCEDFLSISFGTNARNDFQFTPLE